MLGQDNFKVFQASPFLLKMQAPNLDEEELEHLYNWIDEIPFSRAKKNIARDFSDGVLMAELVKHFFPRMI